MLWCRLANHNILQCFGSVGHVAMDDLFSVSEHFVLVTGASGQLGLSYQKAFLERGASVVGLDVVRSEGIDVLEGEFLDKYEFVVADITDKTALLGASATISQRFGVPTVLINNAAIDSPPGAPLEETGPFEGYPESSWDKVIDVNLKGTFLTCQIFGAEMAKLNRGSIINIASIYGLVSPDQKLYEYRRAKGESFYKPVAYSASKSGIMNLTRYLAVYWAKSNLRVNTLTIAGVFNNQDEEFLSAYLSRIPVGKMADHRQYDGAVLFLASQASSYMTGSNLIVDGGWTAI